MFCDPKLLKIVIISYSINLKLFLNIKHYSRNVQTIISYIKN